MVMSPVELGTKNHCAGEAQQQFNSQSVFKGLKGINADARVQYYTHTFNKEGLAMNEQHANLNSILLGLALNQRYASIGEGYRILQIILTICGGQNHGPSGTEDY
jgi:hypothetical protein